MRNTILFALIFIFTVLNAQTTIAVLDFDPQGISISETKTLSDRFRDELTKTKLFIVIERGNCLESETYGHI